MKENLVFNIHRKISLRLGLWPPVVGTFCKRWSDSIFNHLTLWIEPFEDLDLGDFDDFDKNDFFFESLQMAQFTKLSG